MTPFTTTALKSHATDHAMKITRVLVAVDFSAASMAALDYARDCALQLGGTLTAVHVIENRRPLESGDAASPEADEQARQALVHAMTGTSKAIQAQAVVVRSARPAEAILDCARTAASELIIMGMDGGTDGMDFFMGSVAQQVVRYASCPVLTLRHGLPRTVAKRT